MSVQVQKCNDCCVWMKAGILSYKICDRNFDCEQCPLDSVLQTETATEKLSSACKLYLPVSVTLPNNIDEISADLLRPYTQILLRMDLNYSQQGLWAQGHPGNYFRIGLTSYLLELLPESCDVVILAASSRITAGTPLGWMYLHGKTIPLISPVSGTLIRRNADVSKLNGNIRSAPYELGWLAVIQSDAAQLGNSTLVDVKCARGTIEQRMKQFIDSALAALAPDNMLGLCMNDGGPAVGTLEQALGEQNYISLVMHLLNGSPATV
jgi:glycine cleavage system H lipoate-binding protein